MVVRAARCTRDVLRLSGHTPMSHLVKDGSDADSNGRGGLSESQGWESRHRDDCVPGEDGRRRDVIGVQLRWVRAV